MNRRHFLQISVMGSAAVWTNSSIAATGPTPNPAFHLRAFEWDEMTISQLSSAMSSGRLTAASLARQYLRRIHDLDQRGPKLNSVIELNPDALSMAEALDLERQKSGPRGPLHGIPILIKDNIATHDKMQTTAGSLALVGSVPPADAFLVQRLRAAGAVILGKTNLSEWANYRSTHSTSGWSGRGGLTLNPYELDRNPCGSSSGSAVAVSANLCAVAVGTETDGSITMPSSYNGLAGIKPTLGLVSRSGIIPIAHSQDTAGPMARTVADAAILLGCLAGLDGNDPMTSAAEGKIAPDYSRFLDVAALKGARIGVTRQYCGVLGAVDQLFEQAIAAMKSQGALISDPADLPSLGKFGDGEDEVLAYEFKEDVNKYLAWLGPLARVHSLSEIIAFNEREKAREMPWFGQELFLKAQAKGPLTDKAYLEALAQNHRLAREEGIDAVMEKLGLDSIIAPTGGPAYRTDLLWGDRPDTGGCSSPAAIAGYPHITVPMGLVDGLPVGISFFGRAWSEPKLLGLAYAFEQVTKARKPPQFLASL